MTSPYPPFFFPGGAFSIDSLLEAVLEIYLAWIRVGADRDERVGDSGEIDG